MAGLRRLDRSGRPWGDTRRTIQNVVDSQGPASGWPPWPGGGALPASASPVSRSHPLREPMAGAGDDLAPGLSVSTTYAGEVGDSGRQALLVGLIWKF